MINLTPKQSHYVLQNLVARRRLRASEIVRALKDRQREIQELRERLATLEALEAPSRRAARRVRKRTARSRRMSPRVRALRRRQGQYMGFVRRLAPAQKARVRAVKEKQGIEAAIRLASSLRKK